MDRTVRFVLAASLAAFGACTTGDAQDAGHDATVRSVHACNGPVIDGGPGLCIELDGYGTPTCNGGTLTHGPCDRTGAVGGCSVVQGENTATNWYYSGDTMTIQRLCSGIGGTFVAP